MHCARGGPGRGRVVADAGGGSLRARGLPLIFDVKNGEEDDIAPKLQVS